MTTRDIPYSSDLGGRDPMGAMRDAIDRIRGMAARWTQRGAGGFERSYAPGKWTARQILVHLAQAEIALGNRARMALGWTPGPHGEHYVAQPFEQDAWLKTEATLGGREAADALVSLNAMNRALFTGLSSQDRATPFSHPEYGSLTVDWLIHQMAGHLLHHLAQLEAIDAGAGH